MIILTGGAGFIGSCTLAQLNEAGIDDILVVDHLGQSEKWKNLQGKRFEDYIPKAQLLPLIERNALPAKIDAVIHLGACSSTTELDAEYMMQNNYQFSRKVCEWAISRGTRVIYASSAATYGDGGLGFSDDDTITPALRPLNVYGFSKQLFDHWALRTGAIRKMAGLKFFNVFGPNEYHKGDMSSVVLKAFHQIQNTGEVALFRSYRPEYQDGEQLRDFISVESCTAVIMWLLNTPSVNGLFNLGTGTPRSWNDLAKSVFSALNLPPRVRYIDMPVELRGRYQYLTAAKMEKLRQAGYTTPFPSLEEGVRTYIQRYLVAGLSHR